MMPGHPISDSQPRKSILFVDDEPLFLEMIELLAQEQGSAWEVLVASTAHRALELLKDRPVDVAVIDLRMPVMDGTQLLGILQRLYPQLLKIVLTGYATEDSKSACLKGGANFFLEKPQSVEGVKTIFATLRELISVQPARGFRGMLVRVDLPEVIQMECLSRHSSVLEVLTESSQGEIFLKDGNIIHAQTNTSSGEAAFQQLLQLTGGEFRLKNYVEPPAISMHGSWEFLLMEAVRLRDETLHTQKGAPPAKANPAASPAQTNTRPVVSQEQPPRAAAPAPVPIPSPTPRQALSPAPAPPLPPAAIPVIDPVRLAPPARPAARIEETVVCSPQGEVIHEWQCASIEQRLRLMSLISDLAKELNNEYKLGPFKRLEIDSDQGRLVVVVQHGNRILVRSRRDVAR